MTYWLLFHPQLTQKNYKRKRGARQPGSSTPRRLPKGSAMCRPMAANARGLWPQMPEVQNVGKNNYETNSIY